jgi:hypothetical protein
MSFNVNRPFQRKGFAKETALPFEMLRQSKDFFNKQ